MGSTLLRSPGRSRPLQYDFSGSTRSACSAACARLSRYAAKRCCCAPGAEALALMPTECREKGAIATNFCRKCALFYNTVVLVTEALFGSITWSMKGQCSLHYEETLSAFQLEPSTLPNSFRSVFRVLVQADFRALKKELSPISLPPPALAVLPYSRLQGSFSQSS